jgi:hypothetical protein
MSSRLAKIAAVCVLAAAIAGVLVGLGAGAGQREVAAAAYAIERPSSNGHSFLVRVDPRTLRPVGSARLDLGADAAPPARSPDGTGAAFSAWPSAELRFVDLPRLRALGTLAVAGEGAFIKADGWLTADRLVALVQRNRGQYKSIVASRAAVVVDPLARKVIGRVPVGDLRALLGSAQAGDKLVLLFGAGTMKHGPVWIGVLGVDGRFRETAIDIGRAPNRRSTALAVDAQGNHAYLYAAGASLAEVDLDTLQVTRHTIPGAPTLTTARGNSFRQLGWVDEHTLALGGANTVTVRGKETATGMGLALVDTRSWQARVIDSKASGFSTSPSTLVTFQWNGGGLTVYGLDGTRLYHRYDRQAVYANVFREVAVVSKPFGIGNPLVVGPNRMKSDVLSLATGRVIGRVPYNLQPLADPPNLRLAARTSQGTNGNEEPLTVNGDGSSLTGHAADGVASVVVLLLDGGQQPLTIDDSGDFSYQAAVPDQTARTIQALAPDGSLLASVDFLPAASPTAAPPTTAPAATTPLTTAPASQPSPSPPQPAVAAQVAILPSAKGALVAQVDPRTLAPLPGRFVPFTQTPVVALSPDRGTLAVGAGARLQLFDARTFRGSTVLTVGGGEGIRFLAWLTPNRLAIVSQRMSKPYQRHVVSRRLLVVDPASRPATVIVAKTLTSELALGQLTVAGGHVVGPLSSSNLKGSTVQLLVADAQRVRTLTVNVGSFHGVLRRPALVLAPSGKHAYLFFSVLSGGPPRAIDVDLDRLHASVHRLRVASTLPGPTTGVAISPPPAVAVDETHVAVSGVVPLYGPSDLHPAAGVFLVDTRTFTTSLVYPAGRYIDARDRTLFVYGGKVGISAYSATGTRLYHLYGVRSFQPPLLLAGGLGHLLLPSKQLVFDTEHGRGLGTAPAPPTPDIQLVPGPPTRAANPSVRRSLPPASIPDPFATISNHGAPVAVTAAQRTALRQIGLPNLRTIFLLGKRAGHVFYSLGRNRRARFCYAIGLAGAADFRNTACTVGFPTRWRPFLDSSVVQLRPADRVTETLAIVGLAADGVRSIRVLDASGHVAAIIPVRGNIYAYVPRAPIAVVELQALDANGQVVQRERFAQPRGAKAGPPRIARFGFSIAVPKGWFARPYESRKDPASGPALMVANFPIGPFTAGSEHASAERMPAGGATVIVSEAGAGDSRSFPPTALPLSVRRSEFRPLKPGASAIHNASVHGRLVQVIVQFRQRTVSEGALRRLNALLATLRVGLNPLPPRGAKPVQHAEADGFAVDVYRSGVIVFHTLDRTTTAYRLLRGTNTTGGCFTLRLANGTWRANEWGAAKPFADELYMSSGSRPYAPRPPYDGCQISGTYGNRWGDGRDRHAPVEIPFNDRARRFLAERAAARDLAYFVRSPQLTAIRNAMKRGGSPPGSWAIARRYPSRVIALQHANDVVSSGNVGVWSNGRDLIVASERASDGTGLFVELSGGRIGTNNLHKLAFVF